MTSDQSDPTDDEHRVLPFRRPGTAQGGGQRWRQRTPPPAVPPVEGLARYEGGDGDDDYRHRMMVNMAAVAVTVVLAIGGVWLALQLADVRKKQDCLLSGRRNCAPIDIKALER